MRETSHHFRGATPLSTGGARLRFLVGFAALVPLAACSATDRLKPSSIATDDYKVRHPIALAQDNTTIDVFPSHTRGGLDRHTAKQVATLAEDYVRLGQGPILVLFPRLPGRSDQRETLSGIRAVLARSGAAANLEVATYPVSDSRLVSPVRLSFAGLKAKVVGQCGEWPSDLGSASTIQGWENRQYYNFGCATQSMIAAQTADPRDLLTPRGEEPADVQIRGRAIESIRKGVDPSTSWTTRNTTISNVGGSN